MDKIATILGFASGFALMRPHESGAEMIATALVIDAALAPVTAVVAARRGRSTLLWALAGFALGVWALAYVLIVRPGRNDQTNPPGASYPGAPDAA